jgi:hypothetical protein
VNWCGPSLDCEGMQRTHTVHALSLLALALATFTACDAEPNDAAPADDGTAIAAPEPAAPELDEATRAALQAERHIATLTPTSKGRLELINIGDADDPQVAYVQIGSRQLGQILHRLVNEQGATPAEVFLALADADAALPELLDRDHAARVAHAPRKLGFVAPRVELEYDANECLGSGGNPLSLSSWVADWTDRFRFIYTSVGNEFSAQNTANGTTSYSVNPDVVGRVLSACNAAQNDPYVSFWALTYAPGPQYPYTYLWGAPIDSFDAVHLHDDSSGVVLRMAVGHGHPSPKTYVATGRCNGGC